MRIQTNLNSLNALRNLGVTESQQSSEIAKLSSGYAINRAGDDAAGLSIANSLRSAGKALGQAQKNASQAGSFLQIADGATQTLSTMLDRMRELATEAGSDNVTDTDRTKIQAEFSSLQSEWNRIVNTTQYQGTKLLTGGTTLDTATGQSTANAVAGLSNLSVSGAAAGKSFAITEAADGLSISISDGTNSQTVTTSAGDDTTTQHVTFDKLGISFDIKGDLTAQPLDGTTIDTTAGSTPSPTFRVGSGTTGDDTISVTLNDLSASTLGISSISVSSSANASSALGAINTALDSLNTAIGNIGAAENRMDYATANLNSLMQNTAAAESTIRDADMAQEYTNYTKLSILQQAGTAMLAQANSSTQSVLQLLRG